MAVPAWSRDLLDFSVQETVECFGYCTPSLFLVLLTHLGDSRDVSGSTDRHDNHSLKASPPRSEVLRRPDEHMQDTPHAPGSLVGRITGLD